MKLRSALAAMFAVLCVGGCGGGGSADPSPPTAGIEAPAAQAPTVAVVAPSVQAPNDQPRPAVSQPPIPNPAPAEPFAPVQQPSVANPPPPTTTEPPAAPAAPVVLSSNIAAWGDSLTRGYAPKLALDYPQRTVSNGGVGGETSPQIRVRMVADTDKANWIAVFWYGRNNWQWPEQVLRDIDLSVRALAPGNARFVVLPVLNASNQYTGTADYNRIMLLNEAIAAAYPSNFLDIRGYLVSLYDPTTPQDVADHANDVTPSSLRTDIVHLTPAGYQRVADRVAQFIAAKGW